MTAPETVAMQSEFNVDRVGSLALFADVLSYATDQAREFRLCAGHHSDHNRGAESVAIRAAEILDRIAADLRSANVSDDRQLPGLSTPESTKDLNGQLFGRSHG